MTLSKRRHRNLTASITNSFSSSLIIQNNKSLLDHKSIRQQQPKPQPQPQQQQGLSTDDYLEKFLDSLQDINNYLDKKLSQSSLSAQQQQQQQQKQRPAATNPNASNKVCSSSINNNNNNRANKLADKRTRRNLTQPIFLNNDLYRFSLER